jgi:uncharacterized coiled-coil protein SlyX
MELGRTSFDGLAPLSASSYFTNLSVSGNNIPFPDIFEQSAYAEQFPIVSRGVSPDDLHRATPVVLHAVLSVDYQDTFTPLAEPSSDLSSLPQDVQSSDYVPSEEDKQPRKRRQKNSSEKPIEATDDKKKARMEKNRLSAQLHRSRKRAELEGLEKKVFIQDTQIKELHEIVSEQRVEIDILNERIRKLTQENAALNRQNLTRV